MNNKYDTTKRNTTTFTDRLSRLLRAHIDDDAARDSETADRSGRDSGNDDSGKLYLKKCEENIYNKMWKKESAKTAIKTRDEQRSHITIEDIDAMKRWFLENWKAVRVIPFEILTLETFLITYFGYTYDQVINLNPRKYKVIEHRYALFLSAVGDNVHRRLFEYDNLKKFMDMCKRNFNKQKSYNPIIQGYIKETMLTRMGYLVNAELAMELKQEERTDIMIANSKTRYHTIMAWLKNQKHVYIPTEFRTRLNIENDFDAADSESELSTYLVGYGSYLYTDVKTSPIGITGDDRLAWFVALNNYVTTQPLLTIAPQIKNFDQQPHIATLTCKTENNSYNIEMYLLVDWVFYNKYKNPSGMINIHITEEQVLINSENFEMENDKIDDLMKNMTLSINRLTGQKILGTPSTMELQIRRSVSKMGSFMSKLESSRNKYLSQKENDLYKIAVIAGKASGKTSLINIIKEQLCENVFIEDSDDYGKFITYIVDKYKTGDLEKLNQLLTEELVVNEARQFAELIYNDAIGEIPSYYNTVVNELIKNEVDTSQWDNLKEVGKQLEFSKIAARTYKKYFSQIRDLYYKLDSGKTLNQKLFENGIINYMKETNLNLLVEFFHIFSCNYRRKAANVTFRYETNFDTDIALYTRIKTQNNTISEGLTEILLKMYYDQSAEYVTSISGPSAFMCLFGLIPVLSMEECLCFKFVTHADSHRVVYNPAGW